MAETREQATMRRATLAVRNLLAQSKNPRTTLGRMAPTSVAFHVAWAAIDEYRKAQEEWRVQEYRKTHGDYPGTAVAPEEANKPTECDEPNCVDDCQWPACVPYGGHPGGHDG